MTHLKCAAKPFKFFLYNFFKWFSPTYVNKWEKVPFTLSSFTLSLFISKRLWWFESKISNWWLTISNSLSADKVLWRGLLWLDYLCSAIFINDWLSKINLAWLHFIEPWKEANLFPLSVKAHEPRKQVSFSKHMVGEVLDWVNAGIKSIISLWYNFMFHKKYLELIRCNHQNNLNAKESMRTCLMFI